MDISVVVPIYKGKKYIQQVVKQVEACKKHLQENSVELLLLNDYPEESIESVESETIEVRVFNADENLGIQGTRVKGCRLSRGEYILFLDQDDKISEMYLKSQLENVKKNDAAASICRVKENGREKYNTVYPFECVIDKEHMFGIENAIISPGQVLLKKSDISEVWKNNILRHNGADDWLLWLCMMSESRKMVLNDENLFEHIISGSNASWDGEEMLMSEKEVYKIISEAAICEPSLLIKLENLVESKQSSYIRILEKHREMLFIYDKWMTLECEKGDISEFLYEQGYKKVVIYGMGMLGKQLIRKLRDTKIQTVSVIDQNANYIDSEVDIITFEEFKKSADLIIVTPIQLTRDFLMQINQKTNIPTVSFGELLERWEYSEKQKNGDEKTL